MLDTTELVHSLTSPPVLSPDMQTVSDNLLDPNYIDGVGVNPQFFQDSEDLDDEDLDDLLPPWEDDTID